MPIALFWQVFNSLDMGQESEQYWLVRTSVVLQPRVLLREELKPPLGQLGHGFV